MMPPARPSPSPTRSRPGRRRSRAPRRRASSPRRTWPRAGATAGRLVKAVRRGVKRLEVSEAARAAIALTDAVATWTEALEGSEAARQLAEADLAEDVRFAAKPDRFTVVPSYADRRIT